MNIYLPDEIFVTEANGNNKLVPSFTFEQRINLLSQSIGFINLTSLAVVKSLFCLRDIDEPVYFYAKKRK